MAKKQTSSRSKTTTKKSTAKKAPAKKTTAKKATAKKAPAKKAAAKKTAAKKKKAPVKKTAAKKKSTTKKAAPKKKTAAKKKTPAKKPAAKKKSTAKKAAAKKPATKKPVAKKATAKKPAAKKPAAKAAAATPSTTRQRKKQSVKNSVVSNQASSAPAKRIAVARRQQIEDIRPYLRKSGEAYMNDAQKAHFREILMQEKMRLMNEVDRTVSHMKDEAANFPDPADRATQEEEFSLELRTRDRERKLIKKIENTLDLIDNDDYGYCETCGVEIGIERLEARPTATKCIDCKTLDEHKEKKELG